MTERTFHSNEISCEGCTSSIKKVLSALDGVQEVHGDPEDQRFRVTYDENKVSEEQLLAAVSEAGFPSEPVA
jgi:copper chaperone CopZ